MVSYFAVNGISPTMKAFLRSHMVYDKKSLYNFLSLKSGKFYIPPEDFDEFTKLWVDYKHKEERSTALAFRWPHSTPNPLYIDVDFRLDTHEGFNNDDFLESCKRLCEDLSRLIGKDQTHYIIQKNTGYYKTISGEKYYCIGVHLYFPDVILPKDEKLALYTRCIEGKLVPTIFNNLEYNPKFGVVDTAVFPKEANGLLLILDFKNAQSGGQYLPRIECTFKEGEFTSKKIPQTKDLYASLFKKFYNFTCWPGMPPVIPPVIPKIENPPEELIEVDTSEIEHRQVKDGLDLREFLKCTNTHVPNHGEWVSIILYCKGNDMKKEEVCALCNEYWKPKNINESAQLWDQVQYNKFTKGSIIWYLNLYGANVDMKKVFPKTPYFQFYSQAHQFMFARGKTWKMEVLENYCDCVFGFVAKFKKYVYKDRIIKKDKYGNYFDEISTSLTDKRPFSGEDSILVRVERTYAEVVKLIQKMCPKQTSRNLDDVDKYVKTHKILTSKASEDSRKEQLIKLYELPEKEVRLGKILMRRNEQGYIKRYISMEYKPFLYDDPTQEDVYNSFTGFPLLHYTPNKVIDVEKTNIWTWLFNVYADKNPKKFEFILNALTRKLKHPDERSERLFILLSTEHGVGKTSYYHFWRALTSAEHCVFYQDFKTYNDGFNMLQACKLICYIDDCSGITKTEAQSLNSRVTCTDLRFNEKNEKAFVLNVCDELILSTNENNVLYTVDQDRRQLYIRCSNIYKQNRAFFAPLYNEFNNKDVMFAWFIFLTKGRECPKLFNYQDDPFNEETQKQKVFNMKGTWSFIINFFSRENWPLFAKPSFVYRKKWFEGYEI